MATKPDPRQVFHDLTERQKLILRLLAQGMTDREMAKAIGRSVHTVSAHIRQIGTRVGIPRRTAMVAEAIRAGVA